VKHYILRPFALIAATFSSLACATPSLARIDLTGHVADTRGRPIEQATVYIYTAGPRHGVNTFCPSCYLDCGKHRETGRDGRFTISGLDESLIFRTLVVARGFEPRFVEHVDPAAGPMEVQLNARDTMALDPSKTVYGRVVDSDGRAVTTAPIEVKGIATRTGTMYGSVKGADPLAVSDSRGNFMISTADSGAHLVAVVRARGFAPRYVDLVAGGSTDSVLLSRGATLTGRVVRGNDPVPGVVVVVSPDDPYFLDFTRDTIGTDSEGTYRFVNLPCNRGYRLTVSMESLRPGGATRSVLATLGDQDSTSVAHLLVVEQARRLSGRVVFTDGRAIPEGMHVTVSHGSDSRLVLVGPDGRFEADGVPPEAVTLSVALRGYRFSSRMPASIPRRYATVMLGMTSNRDNVELVLEPGTPAP
jgi:hypothetical protein